MITHQDTLKAKEKRQTLFYRVTLTNFLNKLQIRNVPRYSLWDDTFTYKQQVITMSNIIEEPNEN